MNNKKRYAEVILSTSSLELDHPFDYIIPPELFGDIRVGTVVLVPFQSRLATGYVVRLKRQTAIENALLKEIRQAVISSPVFSKETLKLIYWMSFYYLQPVGRTASLFLPPGGQVKTEKIWVRKGCKAEDITFPVAHHKIQKDKSLKKRIEGLKKQGLVEAAYRLSKPKATLRYEDIVHINNGNVFDIKDIKGPAQKRILEYLQKNGPGPKSKVLKGSSASIASLRSLAQKGILLIKKERAKRVFRYEAACEDERLQANKHQKICLQEIRKGLAGGRFCAFLIEGVAGSGKTKVYIDACKEAVNRGKRALVLTPEISLTPQLFSRFESVFKEKVCIYHSNMGTAERYESWMGIADDEYQIVIGTRSAAFTPIKDLGIIILDEEHDPSYKESSKVRYNTGDVAVRLGKILNIPVVFGSATPSVTLRYRAEQDVDFTLLKMPEKASFSFKVQREAIDLKKEPFDQNPVVSKKLHKAIREEIDKKNKVIVFLNKRGYSNFIICNSCGYVPKCPACSLSFKYHIGPNLLLCHHCAKEIAFEKKCAKCGKENILLRGTGIQKVERQLKLRFDVPVYRMDSDSTARKKSHQKILNRFTSVSPSILLGTQMIAKGLDIEDVTLVGIINCDPMLELPDYHMNERVYQLICQVAGRAGRKAKKGRVLLQTYNPGHEVIKCFLDGDYDRFYSMELKNRKELFYPPFSKVINIIVSGKTEQKVKKDCMNLFTEINKIIKMEDNLLGPAPSPFYRINHFYRWHVIIKTAKAERMIARLNRLVKNFKKDEASKLIVDVEPAWIL